MARVYPVSAFPHARPRPGRAAHLPAGRASTRARAGLEGLRALLLVFQRSSWLAALPDPAHPGHPAVQPGGLRLGAVGRDLQHDVSFVTNTNWQFYGGETTLTLLPQMVGLAVQNFVSAAVGIAVLVAVIRGIVAAAVDELGQLLAGPDPHPPLRPAADLDRRRALPRLPGGRPDARRLPRRPTLAGGAADDRGRPGRLADRDQAARHQRRRLLQRQLLDAVREPDRALELRRAALRSS